MMVSGGKWGVATSFSVTHDAINVLGFKSI